MKLSLNPFAGTDDQLFNTGKPEAVITIIVSYYFFKKMFAPLFIQVHIISEIMKIEYQGG